MYRRDFFPNTGAATLATALPAVALPQEAATGERRQPKVRPPDGWTLAADLRRPADRGERTLVYRRQR